MKKYLAELIGTFALVLVGAGAICVTSKSAMGIHALLTVAFAHGLTVMAMIYALGHISGAHINPAVTIALRVCGKISVPDAVGYITAQLIGAAIAGATLRSLFDTGIVSGYLGATDLTYGLPQWKGVMCEAIGTFLFLTVIFGAAVDGRTAGNNVGLAIGFALTALILVFGPLTGASFNPARSFGPALAADRWANFWVYLVGPIVGGSLAGLLQTRVFMKGK